MFLFCQNHPHFSKSVKPKRLGRGGLRPGPPALPHASVVVVQQVGVVAVGVAVVRMPDGVLVHGGVGLGGGVEGGRHAVTGLTAVVAVPVIHGAVRILVCGGGGVKTRHQACGTKNKVLHRGRTSRCSSPKRTKNTTELRFRFQT